MHAAMMKFELEDRNDSTVISIKEKRLDAHNAQELKEQIVNLLDSGKTKLVVELSDVRFVDSSGLGVLLSGFKNAASHQGGLCLSGLQPQVKSMFELTRLHRVFTIHSSLQEALAET